MRRTSFRITCGVFWIRVPSVKPFSETVVPASRCSCSATAPVAMCARAPRIAWWTFGVLCGIQDKLAISHAVRGAGSLLCASMRANSDLRASRKCLSGIGTRTGILSGR